MSLDLFHLWAILLGRKRLGVLTGRPVSPSFLQERVSSPVNNIAFSADVSFSPENVALHLIPSSRYCTTRNHLSVITGRPVSPPFLSQGFFLEFNSGLGINFFILNLSLGLFISLGYFILTGEGE